MSTTKLRKVDGSFSDRLKMLRLGRGWSQEDLAVRLNVSPGSVGNWEMGPHVPHPRTLNKIGELFEVDVAFLLHGERHALPVAMREKSAGYSSVNLGELLREIEGARDILDRIAQQLRRAEVKPSAAAALTEMAAAGYDRDKKRGAGKNQEKETSDPGTQRVVK